MLFPVSKLETLSLSLETHVGLGFWLDWKELMAWPLVWHLFPRWSRESRQHK